MKTLHKEQSTNTYPLLDLLDQKSKSALDKVLQNNKDWDINKAMALKEETNEKK